MNVICIMKNQIKVHYYIVNEIFGCIHIANVSRLLRSCNIETPIWSVSSHHIKVFNVVEY